MYKSGFTSLMKNVWMVRLKRKPNQSICNQIHAFLDQDYRCKSTQVRKWSNAKNKNDLLISRLKQFVWHSWSQFDVRTLCQAVPPRCVPSSCLFSLNFNYFSNQFCNCRILSRLSQFQKVGNASNEEGFLFSYHRCCFISYDTFSVRSFSHTLFIFLGFNLKSGKWKKQRGEMKKQRGKMKNSAGK